MDAAYRQAYLSGNYAALEEVFAPDAVEVNPAGVFRGGPAIRGLAEAFIRANPGTTISYGETTVVENTAVHRAFVASDPIRETGVERIVLLHTLVVSQGKAITLTSAWDPGDPETMRYLAAVAPAMDAG
ncbi:MAG: nuclear transport factor 2 family protein, partial [Chloroflexota bacterium]|nr:nuclear transport factor 2 family protein [Chloroflexota bacterium]